MQNTKQTILSASLIAVFVLFVFYEKSGNATLNSTTISPITEKVDTSATLTQSANPATDSQNTQVVAPPTVLALVPDKSTPVPVPTQKPIVKPTLTPQPVIKPTPVPTPVPTPATQASSYKNGNFTGKVADAYFGNLQVAAVISGGKLSDVKFLQYPNDQPQSLEISERSMPKLKSEAISSQNAKVDIISGATQTSEAFNESLADALLQAKA